MSPAPTPPSAAPPSPTRLRRVPLVGVAIVAVVVLALVAVLVSRGGGDDDDNGEAATLVQQAPVEVTGTALPRFDGSTAADPAVGQEAPTVKGVGFDGTAAQAGGTGQRQLLVFVAHWCPHCNREVPRLVSWMADGGVPDGTTVTAVVTGTDKAAPNYPPSAWLAEEDWKGGVLVDDATYDAGAAYGLSSYPYMVLLAPDGTVIHRAAGELSPTQLDALVAASPSAA